MLNSPAQPVRTDAAQGATRMDDLHAQGVGGASGEGNARAFEVYGYAFMASKPGT